MRSRRSVVPDFFMSRKSMLPEPEDVRSQGPADEVKGTQYRKMRNSTGGRAGLLCVRA